MEIKGKVKMQERGGVIGASVLVAVVTQRRDLVPKERVLATIGGL
jgi:hypothetical protein